MTRIRPSKPAIDPVTSILPMSRLFVFLQYLIPHQAFSRLVGWFMGVRLWKSPLIHWFVHRYGVDLTEAEREQVADYDSFNDFFTRRLKIGARPHPEDAKSILCPADGTVSQAGSLKGDVILQAKGHGFRCADLLTDTQLAAQFKDGSFATVYLSPKDYHRVHMPFAGRLSAMIYVPGRLFSVNPTTTAAVPNLFARNERVVCLFETELGPMAVVLVGAMIVASIETSWAGTICPGQRGPQRIDYTKQTTPLVLNRGDELGLFKTGSTVIVLFTGRAAQLDPAIAAGRPVRMGQTLATACILPDG